MQNLALYASLFFDQLPKMHTDELTLHAIAWPGIASAIFAAAGFILACCKWASESKADEARRNLADEKDNQRREWAFNNFKNSTDKLNRARAELQNVSARLERAERTITRQELIKELLRDRGDHDIRMTLYSTALSLAEDRIKGLMENGGDHDKAIIDLEDTVKELKNQIDALRHRLEFPPSRAPGSLGQASAARSRIPVRVRQNSAAGGAQAGQRGSRPGRHPP